MLLSACASLSLYPHIRASVLATFVLVVTILRYNPSAYNIDLRDVQVFGDPVFTSQRGSYFGFSVALYAGPQGSLLLVGAPRANSTALREAKEPGTVFACRIDNNVCKEWVVDNGELRRDKRVHPKNNSWIGATIAVENKTVPRVVVCGPRWQLATNFTSGICYGTLATNVEAFEREADQHWIPVCDGTKQNKSKNVESLGNYGLAQVGFSLHMDSRSHDVDIVLGGPGVLYGKGDTILITDAFKKPPSQPIIPLVAEKSSHIVYDYFGYAVTAGAYFNRGEFLYASGATRGYYMYGKVLIFKFPSKSGTHIELKARLNGEQVGEYFGAALTSCDINNDGKDELLVGAPNWSQDMDEGRVYIYTAYNMRLKPITIDGKIAGGRYGSALMCLGDLDYDGYEDIAVGAPYEAESGGAVYIYYGNVGGVSREYDQKLIGSRYSPLMRGFGISISEPRDINGDKYPDFAVGACFSDNVVLFKTVPVVTVTVAFAHLEKIRLLENARSFVIDVEVHYEGAYAPESLRIVKVLKIDQMYRRAYREQKNKDGIYRISDTIYKDNGLRSRLEIHLEEDIQNILDPLELSVSVELEDELSARSENSSKNASSVAINKHMSKTEDMVKLPFVVDCGEDDICVSDLNVTLSTNLGPNNSYVIGSPSTISLQIDAHNSGEVAYETKVHIFIEALSLASTPRGCTENSRKSSTLDVVCKFGKPLRTHEHYSLTMQLDASKVTYDTKKAVIRANISTRSNESMLSDNEHAITVHFDVDMDIAIVGKKQESSFLYSRVQGMFNNTKFKNVYQVQSSGVSPIDEATLTARIPTHWQHRTGDIVVANIDNIVVMMSGKTFRCDGFNYTDVLPLLTNDLEITSDALVIESLHVEGNSTHVNISNAENAPWQVPPANRTLFINCTSGSVRCQQVSCKVGPFKSTGSVAELQIELDLLVPKFHATLMENKDIVFFVTEGNVAITQPYNITQRKSHKPDTASVATTFLGASVAERIAVWILALSIGLGIILLLLLTLALIKFGFFTRKKKMELEALKAETDKKYNVVLETASSTEVLDND